MNSKTLLFFLILTFGINAQQHDLWHFGDNTGLDFTSGSPVPIGSAIETTESCYTMTDANGNLLFYTNGVKVWDSNHNLMPNGTGLNGSTSSQCIALAKPNTTDRYYIIYNSSHSNIPNTTIGTFYSEVDLSLNGGLGDVITSNKNILLKGNSGEWISASPHSNCEDTWILTHGDQTNPVLNAFKLTNSGINTTPVTSNIGVVFNNSDHAKGTLKPRPQSNQFVMTKPLFSGTILLFDFNNSNGTASNINMIHSDASTRGNGAEFSRDGNVLYVGSLGNGKIHQYDLTAGNISTTRTEIGDLTPSGEAGALQIAPDDKIYVNYNVFPSGSNFLGVINNPSVTGTGCGYVENAVNLGAVNTVYGLPWYYNPTQLSQPPLDLGNDTTICAGDHVQIDGDIQSNTSENYLWSDGSTDSVLTTNEPGTYWLERQVGACTVQTDTIDVIVDEIAFNQNLLDTSGCGELLLKITPDNPDQFSSVQWELGDGNTSTSMNLEHTYSTPGNYTVNLTATSNASCNYTLPNIASVEIFPNFDFNISSSPIHPEYDDQISFDLETSQTDYQNTWTINGSTYENVDKVEYLPASATSVRAELNVIDKNGCHYKRYELVNVESSAFIYVPNAFTPDGSGDNDVFRVSDINNTVESISIYNRWGQLIWTTNNSLDAWDGTHNGKMVPDGTYNWKIKYKLDNTKSNIITGSVSVLR